MITTRFGRKLKVPSTFQIKHQILLLWLKDQLAKEAAEHNAAEERLAGIEQPLRKDRIHALR